MDHRTRSPLMALILVAIGLLMLVAPAKADFDYAYCSSQNTDSGRPDTYDYQSNGYCTEHCQGSVFAVLQEKSCWCSNYAPGDDQQSTSNCGDPCPGFPTDKCGNKSKKLYMYIRLGGAEASGTQGGSKPTSSASVSSSSAPPPPSSTVKSIPTTASQSPTSASTTPNREPETVVHTTTGSSSEASSTTPSDPQPQTSSSTLQTSTPLPIPQTSIRTISQSNQVITETVVTTPSTVPVPVQSTEKSATNTGAIIGGVLGGVAGLAAIAGGIVFLLWRRRQQRREEEDEGQTGMQRNVSTMSKSGLLRSTNAPTQPPPIATNFPRRQSRNLDQESISPISGSDRRNSRPMIDQRLNPSALFVLDNSSRGSVASMDDSRDYHRPLNVRNPDP